MKFEQINRWTNTKTQNLLLHRLHVDLTLFVIKRSQLTCIIELKIL